MYLQGKASPDAVVLYVGADGIVEECNEKASHISHVYHMTTYHIVVECSENATQGDGMFLIHVCDMYTPYIRAIFT